MYMVFFFKQKTACVLLMSDWSSNVCASDLKARIAVIGSRGGVGSSTFAVNLAWILAEERKYKTTLIDLDLEFGTIALSLDLEPTRGLREALENPARVDGLFISSATAKLTENLRSEAHKSALQSLMRISYAVFCL